MKKGFTLIELLAVIVILAIIALIATPIILGIINDARKESNERSVELYASAVRNGIAAYQLREGKEVEAKTYKSSELDFVEYDGTVECDTIDIYEDGNVYVTDCKVNGVSVDYEYGTKQTTQVYKPQYYYYGFDWFGTVGTTTAPIESERLTVPPTGKNNYLGYDVTDGKVSAAYACFTRNDVEYCLKPNDFATSTEIIKDAYADVVDTDACSFDDVRSGCYADGLSAHADSYGYVYAHVDGAGSNVDDDGFFGCSE